MTINNASYWINRLNLTPHPEGGYFREFYRSDDELEFAGFSGKRNTATGAYYLLEAGQISRLHYINSDEQWFFLAGDAIRVVTISKEGENVDFVLGHAEDQNLHCVVSAGDWFGAKLEPESSFALVSLVVAPGFDFQDLVFESSEQLKNKFPNCSELIDSFE